MYGPVTSPACAYAEFVLGVFGPQSSPNLPTSATVRPLDGVADSAFSRTPWFDAGPSIPGMGMWCHDPGADDAVTGEGVECLDSTRYASGVAIFPEAKLPLPSFSF